MAPRSRAILKKVLTTKNGISTRYLALAQLEDAFDLTPDALHERFSTYAPRLAHEAAARALAEAGLDSKQIDAVIISTCTGYLCPGLTSYLAQTLGLRRDVLALDLVGQGCGAAVPNFRAAEALLCSGNCDRVLTVCVEVCSAAFYLDDDPGVLISACLFGDGAGAVIWGNEPTQNSRRIQWKFSASSIDPSLRDTLRFEQRNGMLRNILTPRVPAHAAAHAEELLAKVLARAAIDRARIAGWILHAGGRDVLRALRERLGLSADDLRWSESVLAEYGNISSPSLIFVLSAALKGGAPDGFWWLSSFGAGFSCHGALIQVG